ncbi:MAG: AAA family ATPase, partial [Sulfuricurvum sp. 24-42-5]
MIDTNLKLTISDTYHIEPESRDLVAGWMLTMIVKLGGHKEFISDRHMSYDDLIEFFGLESYRDDYDRDDRPVIIKALNDLKHTIDAINPKTSCVILEKNINKLCKIIELTPVEIDVFRFCIYLHYYELLENAARLLNDMTSDKFEYCLSVILGHPRKVVKEVFSSRSTLVKNSFLTIDRGSSNSMRRKVDIASNGFADKMMSSDDDIEEMIRDVVRRCEKTSLTLEDYPHLSQQLEILVPYMRHSIEDKISGTNILLYGRPGTGKTELVKAIAQEININLYEVSYADDDEDPIEGTKRLRAYRTAQSLFSKKPIILMFDEIEDVISAETDGLFGSKKRQSN